MLFHQLDYLDCNDDIAFQLAILFCRWWNIKAMRCGVRHKITEIIIEMKIIVEKCVCYTYKIKYEGLFVTGVRMLSLTISKISQSIGSSNSVTGFDVHVLSSIKRGTSIC